MEQAWYDFWKPPDFPSLLVLGYVQLSMLGSDLEHRTHFLLAQLQDMESSKAKAEGEQCWTRYRRAQEEGCVLCPRSRVCGWHGTRSMDEPWNPWVVARRLGRRPALGSVTQLLLYAGIEQEPTVTVSLCPPATLSPALVPGTIGTVEEEPAPSSAFEQESLSAPILEKDAAAGLALELD